MKPLAFLCLDSCRLEGPVQRGLGYLGDNQLDRIGERLAAVNASAETHTLVAVVHHHLMAVSNIPDLPPPPKPEDQSKSEERVITSVTLDAARTLRALARRRCLACAHGAPTRGEGAHALRLRLG